MGTDKRFIPLQGITLLDRARLLLEDIASPVIIIGEGEKLIKYDCPVIPDIVAGAGPLGGIYSGLKHIEAESALFIPCDMPLIQPQLLKSLIRESAGYKIILFKTKKGVQPLPGIYSKACITFLEDAINENHLSVKSFIENVPLTIRLVPLSDERVFLNINRQEDLNLAQRLLNG